MVDPLWAALWTRSGNHNSVNDSVNDSVHDLYGFTTQSTGVLGTAIYC